MVGASGATGRLLVDQLLNDGFTVTAVVRPSSTYLQSRPRHKKLDLVSASLLELSNDELTDLVDGCDAVASCLGHNLSFAGMFGQPRDLVFTAVERLCVVSSKAERQHPLKFILMNTAGNSNRDLVEPISFAEQWVMILLRKLLPPHRDNERAADFLRVNIGQDHQHVEWVVVRPDGLVDRERVSGYELYKSPTRSAIFNAGTTSRVNVAHFMAKLLENSVLWEQWKGQMPVIYNSE